jgi:spore germination protein YaaH/5-hydroxyisourate hydrolase-like protein (transthyretin family)
MAGISMRRFNFPTISLALVISIITTVAISTTPTSAADTAPRKVLTGWIPYYSMKTALPDVLNNADLIKEVMPFWYTLKYSDKNKTVGITDLYAPANPSVPISEPLNALRNANFQIIPTITDGTAKGVLAGLLKSPTSRKQIITAIMNLVQTNNYDGIDIDFEGFAFVDGNTTWKATAPLWATFIKELAVVLHSQKKLLSVSTPYVLNPADKQKGYYVYAWADIASSIDKLRIMTYDYSVSKVGPLGPITWAERTVQYAVSIMPASKVFVGVPGYGRDWVTAVSGVCPSNVANSVKVGAKAATFVMRDALTLAATYGATPTYNEEFGEVTFTYQKVYNGTTATGLSTSCTATRTAWYQDARGWALRAALVTKYRIGGITAWTFGMEEPLAMESIRAIAKEIAPDQVNVTASVDKTEINYGEAISLNSLFAIKDKSPLVNVPIKIQAKSATDGTWRLLSTVSTSTEGKIEKSLILGKSTTVRLYTESTWERSEGISQEIPITVLRRIVIDPPMSIKSGKPVILTGSARPRTAGTSVVLEKLVNNEWQIIDESATTDANGQFIFTLPSQSRSVMTLRISLREGAEWAAVTGQEFNIIIR